MSDVPDQGYPFSTEAKNELPDKVMGEQKPEFHIPEGKFEEGQKMAFSGEVARVFEEQVIPRQIPGYKQMRFRLLHVAMHFLRPNTSFVDLGTSHGKMLRDTIVACTGLEDPRLVNVDFIGVDREQEMLDQAQILFAELEEDESVRRVADKFRMNRILDPNQRIPSVSLVRGDLKYGLPPAAFSARVPSLITSVLTLQFLPVEHRPRVMRQIYDALPKGGAFIFVEKVVSANVEIDDMFQKLYYEDKSREGIPHSEILTKRGSLEGYLVPFSSMGNQELLEGAGFNRSNIDVFWKDLNFQAYIAIK